MESIEALKFALGKEIASEKMYQEFSKKYPDSKDAFIFLMGEEKKHQQILKKLIEEISDRS